MRILLLIVAMLLAAEAVAQERSAEELYGRPSAPEEVPPQNSTESQESPELWSGISDVLKKFIPAGQPIEQPADPTLAGESLATERQSQWQAATKLTAYEPSDTETAPQPTTPETPHTKNQCLDPTKFQPGQAGCIDYYLFKVAHMGPKEVYLELEGSTDQFCLTNVDTVDLEEEEQVVVLGNVRVRGTKTYKTDAGDKLTVRVVKLLSTEESEQVDAERVLSETEHPMRAWTSKDGKHKIEARFVKFAAGKVYLVNKAGKPISIAPNNLSVADREYYRDLVKKAREATRKKVEEADAETAEPFAGEADPYGGRR